MESQNLSDKATQMEPLKENPMKLNQHVNGKTKDAFLTMVMIDLYDILTLYVRGRKSAAIDIRTSIISLPIHYLPVSWLRVVNVKLSDIDAWMKCMWKNVIYPRQIFDNHNVDW